MLARKTWLAVVALATAVAVTSPSQSGEPSANDSAAARALFDQGRALASSGKYAEACPKLEESQRLDPGMGTLFNLADCYENVGKTASAWSMFLDVASQAKAAGQPEKERLARERAAALEPKLSRLTIVVPPGAEVAGIQVTRDGTELRKPQWNTPVPVDPGNHKIEVKASGKKTWATSIEMGKTDTQSITVPTLEDAPKGAEPPVLTSDVPPANDGSTQRLAGLIVGGAGVVGLGVSVFVGLGAKKKLDDASAYCDGSVCSDMRGVDLHSDARSQANVATIIGGIGLAAIIGGSVLYLTAPSGKSSQSARRPASTVAVGPGSISIQGAW